MTRSVLVVEDDDSVRRSLLRTLTARGLRAVGAADGIEALRLAAADPPSVIIMDLQLPTLSGADIVRALRKDPALASIPVIALSATVEEAPAELFLRTLTKPCSTESLLAVIGEVLADDRSSGQSRS